MLRTILKTIRNILYSPYIIADYVIYKKRDTEKRFPIPLHNFYPQIFDKTHTTNFDKHYVYHTAWAARKLQEIHPTKHIDISSSLYFCSIVSAFIPVDFFDYRPARLTLSNLKSAEGNLYQLPFKNNSVISISCMHTIEHIGLGRYGDKIDPQGDIKSMKELQRVAMRGGNILLVVPVGVPQIYFNAHRVYSYDQITSYFSDCTLQEFTLIPESMEREGIIYNADKDLVARETYACGCFWFIKK